MNGRVYDYNLGRFLSVDPFIQAPTSTQSINPYLYIMNNPMAGTDPTGYMASNWRTSACDLDNSCASTPVDRAFSTYVGNGQQNELSTVAAKTLEKMKSDMASILLANSIFAYVEISDIGSTNQIDFDFISGLEGGLTTSANVPNPDGSKSGATISVGFDLGARDENDLKKLGLSGGLIEKLTPYLGLKNSKAVEFLRANPLTISKAEASQIYSSVKTFETNRMISLYDKASNVNFVNLPAKWQTVIASKFYQYGTGARSELVNFGDVYRSRRRKEVNYLDTH